MTRLYTTMSAEDMTEDPFFLINLDLPDVSNIHTANITIFCNKNVMEWEAPWEIELPNGAGVLTGTGGVGFGPWPYAIDDMPANDMIMSMSSQGSGEVVKDNTIEIGRFLEARKNETRISGGQSGHGSPDKRTLSKVVGYSCLLFCWLLS